MHLSQSYSYGSRRHSLQRSVSGGKTTSGRTLSGRPDSAGNRHGYKGSLLFKPLPKEDVPAPA